MSKRRVELLPEKAGLLNDEYESKKIKQAVRQCNDESGQKELSIVDLPVEILLNIFKHYLDSKTILTSVNRVNKRWNAVTKCKVLWTRLDLTFKRLPARKLRAALNQYFARTTVSLSIRGSWCERIFCNERSLYTCKNKTLTTSITEKFSKEWPNLKRLAISEDVICLSRKSLVEYLPKDLVHLNISKCTVHSKELHALFAKDSFLPNLKTLELNTITVTISGQLVIDENSRLPPATTTFSIQSFRPLCKAGGLYKMISKQTKLRHLDISYNYGISCEKMQLLSSSLSFLQTLNLIDCHFYSTPLLDENSESFRNIWIDGFPSLIRLIHLREKSLNEENVIVQPLPANFSSETSSVVVNGRDVFRDVWTRGGCTIESTSIS